MTTRVFALLLFAVPVFAQAPDYGQGWLPEFNHASKQILALAEATPLEKFSWRPTAGVRSTSAVYMHIVKGNYMLLTQAGAPAPPAYAKLPVKKVSSFSTARTGAARTVVGEPPWRTRGKSCIIPRCRPSS